VLLFQLLADLGKLVQDRLSCKLIRLNDNLFRRTRRTLISPYQIDKVSINRYKLSSAVLSNFLSKVLGS
jgi:hypothetical protein